jgi:hypothetical protein
MPLRLPRAQRFLRPVAPWFLAAAANSSAALRRHAVRWTVAEKRRTTSRTAASTGWIGTATGFLAKASVVEMTRIGNRRARVSLAALGLDADCVEKRSNDKGMPLEMTQPFLKRAGLEWPSCSATQRTLSPEASEAGRCGACNAALAAVRRPFERAELTLRVYAHVLPEEESDLSFLDFGGAKRHSRGTEPGTTSRRARSARLTPPRALGNMVTRKGFEPLTPSFGGWCSIQAELPGHWWDVLGSNPSG